MNQSVIFYPLMGMVFLTFGVGIYMLSNRIKAVKEGLNPAFFSLNRGAKQPDYLIKVSQHYENLFELPILFYIVTVLIYVTGIVDSLYIWLASLFVIVRYLHAGIHITYNNLIHRRNIFAAGAIIMFSMWVRFFIHMFFG